MKESVEAQSQLLEALAAMRRRVAELEAGETQRQRAEKALQTNEATVRALLESASDGIVIVEPDGRIALVNAKVEALFGYCREELLDQPIEMLLPPRLHEIHVRHRSDYLAHPRPRSMGQGLELAGQRKGGVDFPVEVSLSYVETEAGLLIMAFIADITARVRAEEKLRQHTDELEARNEELDAFAHTVAHDLQNSLALIIGVAELLSEDASHIPVEELQRQLDAIGRNGRKMSNIIDELLLLSSVRQVEEVPLHALDMSKIVAEAQERLVDLIQTHQVKISLPETWPAALGYGPWIEEVWVNYLSNAIRYGGQPPRVDLGFSILDFGPSLAESQSGIENRKSKMIRFWVRDNGLGLTPEEQARLFKPFTQLHQAHAKGHGLGLSIVRRIVEKLGGQVGVESEVGQGSLFSFTLPAATE